MKTGQPMKTARKPSGSIMRKYYQLILVIVCFLSVVTLLIYRHEYYRLRYVLEVLNIFGKPGLSEIEFCGPGFNATMLSEILRNTSMEVRETPPLFQQVDDNFYVYSSFLRSYDKYSNLASSHPHEIDTIAIGKVNVAPNFRCNIWIEGIATPKPGKFSYKPINIPINGFQLYIFACNLTKDFGKPQAISLYINDYNINPMHSPINRLIQVNTKRKVKAMRNIRFVNSIVPAICVVPNHIPLVTRDAFIEFLVFHHIMGVNHFTIYDSTISEDVIRRLNLLPSEITQWDIQFFPLNYPFIFAKSYDIIKAVVELDCLFRHFRVDKDENNKVSHIAVLSWDEFLVPRFHNNIKTVLDDVDPTRELKTYNILPQLYCLNQNDDDTVEIGYPDIIKKTHFYKMPLYLPPVVIRNLDSMVYFTDLVNLDKKYNHTVTVDIIAVHKYTECRDPNSYDPQGYNETRLRMFPHKFEGAMLKFSASLIDNKIYRLYRSGQIWERPASDNIRDML